MNLPWERVKGPVEILCEEIGFRFQTNMETKEMLVSFVRVLIDQIEDRFIMQSALSSITGKEPNDNAKKAIEAAKEMLSFAEQNDMVQSAANVHSLCDELNPENSYPTDHLIDMVSSCASAIRFSFEQPCNSRHAANAADHVWKLRYGISFFDKQTSNWKNDWSRSIFETAMLNLMQMEHRSIKPFPLVELGQILADALAKQNGD